VSETPASYTSAPVKRPRRMKEPTKAELRRRLAVANARIAYLELPLWKRAWIQTRAFVIAGLVLGEEGAL
jgi:hypothetical protein